MSAYIDAHSLTCGKCEGGRVIAVLVAHPDFGEPVLHCYACTATWSSKDVDVAFPWDEWFTMWRPGCVTVPCEAAQ